MKKDIPSRVLEGIADLVETYGHSADTIAACVGLEPAVGDLCMLNFDVRNPTFRPHCARCSGKICFFNQDVNAIHVSHEDCNHPLGDKPDASRDVIERELESTLGHVMPFVLRVDRIIRLLINGGGCTANQVADALNMKLRTLQYRLKQNQPRYQTLYDAARLDLARHYLMKSELSIAAVSERLSSTDCAAFSRFFKDRVGDSPRQYAKKAREEALTS